MRSDDHLIIFTGFPGLKRAGSPLQSRLERRKPNRPGKKKSESERPLERSHPAAIKKIFLQLKKIQPWMAEEHTSPRNIQTYEQTKPAAYSRNGNRLNDDSSASNSVLLRFRDDDRSNEHNEKSILPLQGHAKPKPKPKLKPSRGRRRQHEKRQKGEQNLGL